MRVELLNEEEVKNLFKTWGDFSRVCYNTGEKVASEKIGKHCFDAKHFSGSRTTYINFKISDVPRSTIDQLARKTVGMVINVRSQRYCDESNFEMYVPELVKNNDYLNAIWETYKTQCQFVYSETKRILEQEYNKKGEQANEIARGILPIDTFSQCTVGFTIEGLIDFMNKRLCVRSQAPIRRLAKKMKLEVLNVLPELADVLVPTCEAQLFCSEMKPCGKAPSKQEVLAIMDYGITMAQNNLKSAMGDNSNEEK